MWSVQQNQKLIEVESGGGHRSWDFLFSGYHGNQTRLLYIKAREVMVKEIQLQSHQFIVKVVTSFIISLKLIIAKINYSSKLGKIKSMTPYCNISNLLSR